MQQSPKTLKGRVTEKWSESNQDWVELMIEDRRWVLCSKNPNLFKSIVRGDMIAALIAPTSLEASQQVLPQEVIQIEKLSFASPQNWTPLADSMRWRRTVDGATRMSRLRQRHTILSTIRTDLYEQGFLEIETPLLVKGTCPDPYIESISTSDGYLVTSTEYQIKRMIVGGFEKVFTLTKNFRANDRGKHHSTEFTMLEWARPYETLYEIEEDVVRFVRKAFQKLHPAKTHLTFNQCEIDFMNESWERLTVREAFRTYLGLEDLQDFSLNPLKQSAKKAEVKIPKNFENDGHLILSYLLDLLQPNLGKKTPTFLCEWPSFMTSSAQLSNKDPHAAERSELYICGIEVSDGFPFLRDPAAQREYFNRDLQHRKDLEAPHIASSVQIDERYINALEEGIPPGAGMALGMDRLVMVLTGASQLSDVQTFSWDEL